MKTKFLKYWTVLIIMLFLTGCASANEGSEIANKSAEYWVSHLDLIPHEEGGYFSQSYVSEESISDNELTFAFEGERKLSTSIYFLLPSDEVSNFHRLTSDELWYYHEGSTVNIVMIAKNGKLKITKLGTDVENGEVPQVLIPKNTIFGAYVNDPDTYSLVGCMVSPGFEYVDFELFDRLTLLVKYPQYEEMITMLTSEPEQ